MYRIIDLCYEFCYTENRIRDTANGLSFLRKLVKNMGWVMKKKTTHKKTGYELALDDIKHGRIHEYNNLDEFIKEIENE